MSDVTTGPFADIPDSEVHEALRPPPPWPTDNAYPAVIVEAASHQGEGKDYPCVKVVVAVSNPEGKQKKLTGYILSQSPAARRGAVQVLDSLGLTPTDYIAPAQLVGLSPAGGVTLKNETGQDGNVYNKLGYFRRAKK